MTWDLKDWEVERMGLKFLKAMEVEVGFNPLWNRSIYYNSSSFQQAAAKEIIDKLFTYEEKEKLRNLMGKLITKSSSTASEAASHWIKMLINRHIGTATGKIFGNINNASLSGSLPDALNLLGIIYDNQAKFPESYGLFSKLLTDFRTKQGRHYKMAEVKGYFTTALGELENFVKGKIKEPGGENTTNSEPNKPVGTNQAEENGSNEKEETDASEDETETDNNSSDQKLEKIRKDIIAEISQTMQEAKVTDHDLPEDYHQWESLINSKNAADIKNFKENLLAIIHNKKQEKIDNEKLSKFIQTGERTDNPVELKRIIEQIEEFRGEKSYDDLKEKISSLKKKLAEKDIESYRNTNYEMIEKELKNEGIKETELDAEVQKNLKKLKTGGIQQVQIDKIKDEVSNNIKLKSAKKKLEKILEDYQKNPSEEKKQEIFAFINSTNSFYQEVYKAKKNEIDSLLKNGGSPQEKESSESNFPIKPKYIIGGMVIIAVIFVFIEIFRKKKPRSYRV